MRFCLSVPPFTDPAVVVDLARDAEAHGWDGFFLWDHLSWDGTVDAHDPWTLLGAIAVQTQRIRIGTMVTPLSRRRPAVVAKHLTTLDHLSGGRVTLGVGLGDPPDLDFSDLGDEPSYRVRAAITDEALDILSGLLSEGTVSHDGAHLRPPRRCDHCRCSALASRSGSPAAHPTSVRWSGRAGGTATSRSPTETSSPPTSSRRTSASTRATAGTWSRNGPTAHRADAWAAVGRHLADAVGLAAGGGVARRAARAGRGSARVRCPRWGSNPDWTAFKATSSTGWDTGAGRSTDVIRCGCPGDHTV